MSTEPPNPLQIIASRLTPYLGPNTARVATRLCAEQASVRPDGSLTRDETERVLDALRPILRTLLGRTRTEDVLLQLARDLA
jgi:hypothetical protein